MDLAARSALLLALTRGPGFGLELIERVRHRSGGVLRLNRGGAYLALRGLEVRRFVRSWVRRLPAVGRPRRYYELTASGIRQAEVARVALRGLVGPEGGGPSAGELRQMADRVRRAAELSRLALRLRDAGRRAGLAP